VRISAIRDDELSQVISRTNVGAAFQLLVAATAWPWRPTDPNDPQSGIADDVMDNLTDGQDYKTRLILGAYFQVSRQVADVDLRDAERFLTNEHVQGGGIMQWLRDCQSAVDFRQVL
jgi:hypothetical protein